MDQYLFLYVLYEMKVIDISGYKLLQFFHFWSVAGCGGFLNFQVNI